MDDIASLRAQSDEQIAALRELRREGEELAARAEELDDGDLVQESLRLHSQINVVLMERVTLLDRAVLELAVRLDVVEGR